MEENKRNEIQCPKCGCEQIYAGKEVFKTGSAVVGSSEKDRVVLTFMKCDHQFSPGDPKSHKPLEADKHIAAKEDLPKTA